MTSQTGAGGPAPAARPPAATLPVVIAGGGTGGHTSPGLAVAALLRERGQPCVWIGSRGGVEARLAPERGIPYFAIATGKLRRYWSWRTVVDLPVRVPAGLVHAFVLLGRLRPRVVLSTGGFVALPTVVAAALRGIPVVAHEQTAVPGLANRIAARLARRVALSFPESASRLGTDKTVITGNPLRQELRDGAASEADRRLGLEDGVPLVYVTGGAQGAHRINRAVGEVLGRLLEHAQVIHQCGDQRTTGDRAWLSIRRAALPPALAWRYTVLPYVGDELAAVYARASLLVGRAGAGTVNECCHLGVPALYVPLPGASGDEQAANARIVERAGGCEILPQASLTGEALCDRVLRLLAEPTRLKEMGERARSVARPDAAERIVALLDEAR